MSSTTAGTYPESVGSCHPPTPPPSPPPHPAPASALHGAPLSQRFDFAGASSGGNLDDDDDDDFFIRAVEYIEQGYNEAKRRAPLCVCGRGVCAVERDEQRGRWVYVCPSQPKCNHVSVCEGGLDLELQPAVRSHPKLSNNCMINTSSNHVVEPRTPINNVNLRGAGATTPNIVNPQATIPKNQLNSTFQSTGNTTPLHVSPKGPSATKAAVIISPRGARSNGKWPICKCTAGKCRVLTVGCEEYYVCPIAKGQGACSYMVPVAAAVNEPIQTETSGDKHLKENLVEKEVYGNNLIQGEDNNANGSVNPPQPVEKEARRNNTVEAEDNNINGSINPSESDDEIVLTAQTTPSAEVREASPSIKCETTAMAEAPTKSPMPPPYGTSSPINPRSGNRVSPTGRILEACGELMISCCSGLRAP